MKPLKAIYERPERIGTRPHLPLSADAGQHGRSLPQGLRWPQRNAMSRRVFEESVVPVGLSASEQVALQTLVTVGGAMLETRIPERNERCVFGSVVPGMSVYRRLEKRGLLYFTEEEPLDLPEDPLDGFTFTPEVYITDEGRAALAALQLERRT